MNKTSKNKQRILSFLKKNENGATYADMTGVLKLHRATLRRWIMELERDGSVERSREHSRARAIFKATQEEQNEKGNDNSS